MLWNVFVGLALAQQFYVPQANFAPSYTAAVEPVSLEAPRWQEATPLLRGRVQYVAAQPSGSSAGWAVALAAAGLGFVGGRQAMLFMGGSKSSPKSSSKGGRIKVEDRPDNRGNPYDSKRNIQVQKSGFGNFVQKFQTVSGGKSGGKSKYGMPIFLPNGNVNPAYLAAEREDMRAQSKRNTAQAEKKRKGLISKGAFELSDYVRKKVGPVGSGKDFYQSGR
jgi:hypothetical protein